MNGFLLAAGFGTRLWPLSDVRAKPAFPFMGIPLIRYVADMVCDAGVTNLWVNTHHAPDSVKNSLQGYPRAPVGFIHEAEILGTSGALVNAREQILGDEVLVANAKIVSDLDLPAAFATHRRTKALATLVCVPNRLKEAFTHVDSGADGLLRGFIDKQNLADVPEAWTFTGVQILSRRFFDFLPQPGFSDTVKEVYPRILAESLPIAVHRVEASWKEFSTVARYLDLHLETTRGEGHVDKSLQAHPSAKVVRCVVWPSVQIGPNVSLFECVVGEHVSVPPGLEAKRSVLIRKSDVRDLNEVARRGGRIQDELVITPIV